ncbi:MAG: hypothetical protein KDK99_04740, partial [Verrucomicrobiales bacterium]|nr:hypothetical protein [Verrucomicrobiales bacterium]
IILFSDAADSEEPGDYKNLIAEMVKEKTTVSVIGMGSSTDSDAAFLEDIAQRGKGRIFFSDNPLDIPALFAQETVAVARSTFVEEAAPIAGTPGWLEMAAGAMEWPAKVDGYNLTYLKPGAVQALVTKDEYAAPLLAFWRRGSGRVVAVTMPLGGRYSDTVRQWQGYGGFMRSLTRWTMGESLPPGLGLRTELQGSWLMADLYYDESWTEQVMRQAPILKLAHGRTARVSEVPWERLEPGRYRARVDLENQDMVRGAVRLGDAALPFGPLSVMANPEWDQDPQRLQELAEVSRLSGGVERLDLSEVWQAPRPPAWRSLLPILLPILLVLLLLEAWQTRAGWQLFRARTAPQAA